MIWLAPLAVLVACAPDPSPSLRPASAQPSSEDRGSQTKPKAKVTREALSAVGRAWDCRVTESDGVKTWVPMCGGLATFPPLLKQSEGGVVSAALIKVEGP